MFGTLPCFSIFAFQGRALFSRSSERQSSQLPSHLSLFTFHLIFHLKKRNDLTLKEALQAMLREYRLDGRLKEMQARAVWDRIMGKRIGTYTSEVRVHQGVLYVTVLSAPLRQELTFARDKIRDLINEEMGENYVRDVVIR
ncbi:MAG: DUF721 domain-containing protein [Saprospiraceae bacterium]|nr:DUF721 domain-containing protein [Saprospiraceae bacterium]